MDTQRGKGLRFTKPYVRYENGKRVGKWPCGHRNNTHAKRRGRRRPTRIVQ